jgi:glycosyltransferase involved in cell wall biosynthesis
LSEHQNFTVSVVIPTFNRQAETEAAIRSALEQGTYVNEIIIVDDASERPFVLPMDIARDGRVKMLVLAQNLGAAAARQAGIDTAQSELVAFLDSDDTWLPGKLESQLKLAATMETAVWAISCGWVSLEENADSVVRFPRPGRGLDDFVRGCWFSPGSTLLLPRALFQTVGGFDTVLRRLEDYEWFLRFAQIGGQLFVADCLGAKISQGQRAHPDQIKIARRHILERFSIFPGRKSVLIYLAIRSYLELEMTVSFRNQKLYIQAFKHFIYSWLLFPRSRIQLKNWWKSEYKN